ncbi:MAG: hypothetical protein LBL47_01845 [Lactobacillus sp.]|jgi:ABC-type transport system involved in cytochrome bd biosynthesis fused ATPase/permease subunit|nr:hypothetical protein [Lactobacillus sp.]
MKQKVVCPIFVGAVILTILIIFAKFAEVSFAVIVFVAILLCLIYQLVINNNKLADANENLAKQNKKLQDELSQKQDLLKETEKLRNLLSNTLKKL